jgi:hypothetical protein
MAFKTKDGRSRGLAEFSRVKLPSLVTPLGCPTWAHGHAWRWSECFDHSGDEVLTELGISAVKIIVFYVFFFAIPGGLYGLRLGFGFPTLDTFSSWILLGLRMDLGNHLVTTWHIFYSHGIHMTRYSPWQPWSWLPWNFPSKYAMSKPWEPLLFHPIGEYDSIC